MLLIECINQRLKPLCFASLTYCPSAFIYIKMFLSLWSCVRQNASHPLTLVNEQVQVTQPLTSLMDLFFTNSQKSGFLFLWIFHYQKYCI